MVDLTAIEIPKIVKRRSKTRSTSRMRIRAKTAAQWETRNIRLALGELAYDKTNKVFKLGDGETYWRDLYPLELNQVLSFEADSVTQRMNAFVEGYRQFETEINGNFKGLTNAVNNANQGVRVMRENLSNAEWIAERVNLDPITNRLDALEDAQPTAIDLTPYKTGQEVEEYVTLQFQQYAADSEQELNERFQQHGETVEQYINQQIANIDIDLTLYATNDSVNQQVQNLQNSIDNIDASNVDLSAYATNESVTQQIQTLQNAIDQLPNNSGSGEGGSVDLTGVNQEITAINTRIDNLITALENGEYGTSGGGGDGGNEIQIQGEADIVFNDVFVVASKSQPAYFKIRSLDSDLNFNMGIRGGDGKGAPYWGFELQTITGITLDSWVNETHYTNSYGGTSSTRRKLGVGEYLVKIYLLDEHPTDGKQFKIFSY